METKAHIPFVNGKDDLPLLRDHYEDSEVVRSSLRTAEKYPGVRKGPWKLWIDAEIDGYHHFLTQAGTYTLDDPPRSKKGTNKGKVWRHWATYHKYIEGFARYKSLAQEDFVRTPDQDSLSEFVHSVMDRCLKLRPAWITVPQLPLLWDGQRRRLNAGRNKVNRGLAEACNTWRKIRRFTGRLVLPVIIFSQNLYQGKTRSKRVLDAVERSWKKAKAEVVWAVDSDLADQEGRSTFRTRFRNLVQFHVELRARIPHATIVAGPYWGMNLVLWARELADYPAIGVGGAYQYHVSGGMLLRGAVRLPLPPLRRWAECRGKKFSDWLSGAIPELAVDETARAQITYLRDRFGEIANQQVAKGLLARFYRGWFEQLEALPPGGRALGLYQDLSSAYALGKSLGRTVGPLPEDGPSRDPAIVAQQLMLNCL